MGLGTNKLSKEQLKALYKVDTHKWMEVISENEKNHPCFKTYKSQKERLRRLIKKIKFDSEFNVVEFGCGNGLWADLIYKYVKSYIGVDFSAPFIQIAKNRHQILNIENTRFFCEEILNFSKNHKNEYDRAFAMDFSEHIYDHEFITIFTAIKNTLKSGGELFIHTPNGDYFLELIKKLGVLKQSTGHIGIRNDKAHIKLLEKIGFNNIEISYLSHYIKPLSFFHFLGLIPIIGKFFRARLFIKCTK